MTVLNRNLTDYVVIDLETTGLSYKKEAIIEIAAVKVVGGIIADEFQTLVDPGRPIPSLSTSVTGITDSMVAGAPDIREALESFLIFIGDMPLVGHNIKNFDLRFLYRDSLALFGRTFSNDYVDTLRMSNMCLPQLKSHSLGYLAEFYGISAEGAHRALNDCRINMAVYERLKREPGR